MFQAIIQQSTLEAFLEPVNEIVTEARIHVTPDGFRIWVVDPGNVAAVFTTLSTEGFESFEVDHDRGLIGLNTRRLAEAIAFGDADELVRLQLDEETRRLDIQVGDAHLDISCIDPESIRQEPDDPRDDLDLPVAFTVSERKLARALEASLFVAQGSFLTYDYDTETDTLTLFSEGDTDTAEITATEDDLQDVEAAGDALSHYSQDYSEKILGAMPAGGDIRVQVGVDHPILYDYELEDGVVEVTSMIAPRIKTE